MKSVYKNIVAIITSVTLSVPFFAVPVFAFGNNVSDLTNGWLQNISQTVYMEKRQGDTGSFSAGYFRFRVVSDGTTANPTINSSNITGVKVSVIFYRSYGQTTNDWRCLAFYDDSEYIVSGRVYLCLDRSTDQINWTQVGNILINSKFSYNGSETNIVYTDSSNFWYMYAGRDFNKFNNGYAIPHIQLLQNQSYSTILGTIFLDEGKPYVWQGTDSNGNLSWPDGTELNAENVSKYEQIFIVMDSNNDNSVTEEEVNYYNYTYNTSYDYSVFNEDNDFNENQFLYWVATQIDSGVDNPGGGTGEGGSGSITGGIYVGDGSFTQSQTQSIAENAVNVTVTNNNELTQENMQYINQIINNSDNESQENPFQEAISNMNQFNAIARAFATLAGVVFGWLPWWVTSLLSLMFTILFVMIIFRLIHLFI